MGCILNEIAHRTFTLLLVSNVAKFGDTHNFGNEVTNGLIVSVINLAEYFKKYN